ncbi:hypothetical protein ABT247_21115 [Kitasatospora sp. NPDC001539]|uniref:hypothetical protein n=1 Tax=Kitasatospora sp. NPDC001539 TaxID=3154384 RepID=UPI0033236983
MPMWIVDVLVAVVLTTVEATVLVIAFFAIGIAMWPSNRLSRGWELTVVATTVLSYALLVACACGLFLLHLPVAAVAQLMVVTAAPFIRPILIGGNRLRERFARRRRGDRRL